MNLIDYTPFISVIIPIYHDWDKLQLCIKGLQNQTYLIDRFEVIIVNNDPEDGPKDIFLPENFILITETKPGSYAARNAGITIAKGEIFAFIDSDCIPKPDWLEHGVQEISQGIDRVAGKVELYFNSDKLTIAEIYEKAFAFPQETYVKKEKFSMTANLITTAKVFKIVGLFDASLFSGGDLEWGWRAWDKGFSIVYSPHTVVLHPARSRIHEIIQKNKRVVGGLYHISKFDDKKWFIAALLSPLKKLQTVRKREDMTLFMKMVAVLFAYAFELHKCGYWIALKIGIASPARE